MLTNYTRGTLRKKGHDLDPVQFNVTGVMALVIFAALIYWGLT